MQHARRVSALLILLPLVGCIMDSMVIPPPGDMPRAPEPIVQGNPQHPHTPPPPPESVPEGVVPSTSASERDELQRRLEEALADAEFDYEGLPGERTITPPPPISPEPPVQDPVTHPGHHPDPLQHGLDEALEPMRPVQPPTGTPPHLHPIVPPQPKVTVNAPIPRQDPPPVPIEAKDQETRDILMKLIQERGVATQEARALSEKHFRLGVGLADRGDFENAKRELQMAVESWPENRMAHAKLREVSDTLMGGRETSGLDEITRYQDMEVVRLQQNHMEINNHIRQGERYYAARQYEEALREFKDAVFKIKAIPYPYYPLKNMIGDLESYVRRTQTAINEEQASAEELKRAEAYAVQQGREQAERREILEFIAGRLELAFMLFDQKKFDRCAKICNQILLVDPHYVVARQLKDDAKRLKNRIEGYKFIAEKVRQWKLLRRQDEEAVIPYQDTVRFPSRDEWADISRRALEPTVGIEEAEEIEPDLLQVKAMLDRTILDNFAMTDATLKDAVDRLRTLTKFNLVLDQKAVRALSLEDRRYSLNFGRASVRSVINTLLQEFGLAFSVKPGRVIFITTPERALGEPIPKLHDIADIVARTVDWAAPDLEMMPGLHDGSEQRDNRFISLSNLAEMEPEHDGRYDDLVRLIRRNVAPGTWDTGTFAMQVTPSKQLLAYHTPQVQDELKEFLATLRSHTGTMVSITTRFIAAFDDFLEEAGVDTINSPAFPPYAIQGNLPSLTTNPPSGTDTNDFSSVRGAGFVTNENARTEYYDIRAQTFNTFRGGGVGVFADKRLGNRLNNTGGIAIQFQMLGAAAMQQVLTALHKENKATLIQAPRLTVFNTQRAHIMAVRQQAYIQDLTAQLTGATGALDPEIGILMTGIVLDVTPIVSHDRRYITLEMRPSLADLQAIRNLTLLTANTNQGPFPVNIQLPFVVLQRAEATIIAPDGGTVMLSGFKDIVYRDVEAQVPILGDIPVLGFLFRRKGKSHERRRLHILVTPEIIDLQEIEDAQY